MLCFRCGSHNPDGSEFCSQCGQQFTGDQPSGTKPKTAPNLQASKPASDEGVSLDPGSQVAERYEIKSLLGHGPVGSVYRAHDLEIDVVVALKILSPKLLQTREDRKHFLTQIRAARKINHPNVIRLYDEDSDDDRVFFTMQMLEGLSLRKIIDLRKDKTQAFELKEINPIFSHICQALERAHESTVHGDLKPENIIVLPDMLKVTDFGLLEALPRRPFVAAQKTDQGGYAYLAPEIRASERDIKPAADIYAMGVILCEMLSGEVYKGPSSGLPRLEKSAEGLLPCIKRALNENPSKRHRSAGEFFEELETVIDGKSPSRLPASKPPRPAPSRKTAAQEPEQRKDKAGPPKPPPSRRRADRKADDEALKMDPPTVVNAPVQKDPAAIAPEAPQEITDATELVEELAAVSDEEVQPEPMERDATDRIPRQAMDDQETAVASPGAQPSVPPKARVARPIEEADADHVVDDVSAELKDEPEPVQVLARRPGSQPIQEVEPHSHSARPATEPIVRQPAYPVAGYPSQPPPYGTQPPYPYSQVPPPPSRTPVYIFLSVFLVIVGVVAYFVIDYLMTLKANLAQPAAPIVISEDAGAVAAGPKEESKSDKDRRQEAAMRATEEEAAKKAEAEASKKAAEAARKAEAERQAEDARIAAQKAKAEQARQEEEALRALQAKATGQDKRQLDEKARKAREQRQIEEKRLAEQKKLAAQARAAEERRQAEEKRRAESARQAELVRRKAEAQRQAEAQRKAEAARLASTSLPALEEVPDDGSPPPPVESTLVPPPVEPQPVEAVPEDTPAASNCPKGMVFVPMGSAWIGSASNDPMRNFGEKSLHKVDFPNGYCIDRYEYPNAPGRKPKVNVTWNQAVQLCKRQGKRLCTEEEWEYACKGKGNRSFPYGQEFDPNRCNTEDAEGQDRALASCGTFQRCRSPFGALDMSGNVSEWTESKYQNNAAARTHKGGSATRPNWAVRCAARSSLAPAARKADLGFRCCK